MTARTDLEHELRGPLAATGMITEQEAAELLEMFRAAKQLETAALIEAIDEMVGALPRPFRAVTKKIMFGSRLG
ncbi:hypothetical protein [Nocardia anaemiae]|uniref:hypothetical protein n=1 Tax=Nocardia anaemiae TaxID=263910 RepID=UPI0007A49BD1|nr:hypothetical protein [Nocardia anaemiae]